MNIYNISHTHYNYIKNKILPFTTAVADYFNIDINELRHYHYTKFCQDKLDFTFTEYNFKSKLNDVLAGTTLKQDNIVIICVNGNMIESRKNFTRMHEIIHGVFHGNSQSNQNFAEYLDKKQYTYQDYQYELEADYGASLLIANDMVINECLENKLTFEEIRSMLQCSKQALQNRLINYFYFTVKLPYKKAKQIVFDYSFKFNKVLLYEFNLWKFSNIL